jgi:hypothetical protein
MHLLPQINLQNLRAKSRNGFLLVNPNILFIFKVISLLKENRPCLFNKTRAISTTLNFNLFNAKLN